MPGHPSGRAGVRLRATGALAIAACALLVATGCGSATAGSAQDGDADRPALRISAIPDQDPQELNRLYPVVAEHLSEALDVPVTYQPVTDYAASVNLFKGGDLDLVWFGGLTAAQARHQTPGAVGVAQRDVDQRFHSVFVASTASGLEPIDDVAGLDVLRDRTFTFGSESSTSGRLMPQFFLDEAGLDLESFQGAAGFSGSHDATIALVSSGAYDAGVLNEQVWEDRLAGGEVDTDAVQVIWRTPPYHDYQWVARPDLDERFGDGFTARLGEALVAIDDSTERGREILELFGAGAFVPVREGDDRDIVAIARKLGLLAKAGA